jgi:hypothetical protein
MARAKPELRPCRVTSGAIPDNPLSAARQKVVGSYPHPATFCRKRISYICQLLVPDEYCMCGGGVCILDCRSKGDAHLSFF